ncbi:Cof-type HAD-IIB family hydrolase [Inconstantimicrobium mannanitabidum]|uniref:Uncharacterized protein n=1 Tax=Inconstantimicrobium mannanitabidum TaxID=1604901 RepID=A0ACB5RIH4_9CLOT|nr:Cof-type HAD-IIB family hydrolase [Clostridium sp. TW13]GKX68872.1 hypothetical protein rsdtw13_41300 [Clostridium sp. TW13]
MIKLIASDMDGTLLNNKHVISKENIEAIRKAEAAGVTFVIATGRKYDDVQPLIKAWDLQCQCILMNGAEYRDEKGNILEQINVDKNKAKQIINMMQQAGIAVEIYTNKGSFTTETKEKALEGATYRIMSFEPGISFEEATKQAKELPYFNRLQYITDIDDFLKSEVEIGKILAFHQDVELVTKLRNNLKTIDGLAVASTFATNIEVNNVKAQKGIILSEVVEKMGIKKEEVIVFGDSFNDYSLFTEFPVSFAMGNAMPEIKEIAKYITDTNDNAGVAKGIYKALEF